MLERFLAADLTFKGQTRQGHRSHLISFWHSLVTVLPSSIFFKDIALRHYYNVNVLHHEFILLECLVFNFKKCTITVREERKRNSWTISLAVFTVQQYDLPTVRQTDEHKKS